MEGKIVDVHVRLGTSAWSQSDDDALTLQRILGRSTLEMVRPLPIA